MQGNSTEILVYPIQESKVYHIVRFIQFIIGIIGNTLTCIIILKYKRLRTPSNILLWSIALSDIISCLIAPFITFVTLLKIYHQFELWGYTCCFIIYLSLAGKKLTKISHDQSPWYSARSVIILWPWVH